MADEAIKYDSSNRNHVAIDVAGCHSQVRTVLFCKNSLIAAGLKHLLTDTRFSKASIVSDQVSLAQSCSDVAPDLFIVDASDSLEQVAETIRNLKVQYPEARVSVVAESFDLHSVKMGLEAGANGFCQTASSREVLIKAFELVVLGEVVLPSRTVYAIFDEISAPAAPERCASADPGGHHPSDTKALKLSNREAEILGCLMEGAPNKVIARKFDVAEATVKVHIKAILRKIGAANRTQAAIWATEHLPTKGGISLNP